MIFLIKYEIEVENNTTSRNDKFRCWSNMNYETSECVSHKSCMLGFDCVCLYVCVNLFVFVSLCL